jgi:sulfonate transport system substrate-binding protein
MASFPQNLSRRRFNLGGLSALCSTPFLMPRSLHAEELSSVTLRVASFRGMDSTLLPATGLADFPYKVEFSEFNSGNLIAQAINADAVDLGEWSEIPLAFIAASGARVKVVAAVDGPTTNQAVIVPANSPARSFVDLKNRKIGYIRSTTAHYFLIRMLAKVGLTLADITPVPLGMSQGLAALKSGSIDAWATYGYVIPMLVGDGAARILESAENILSGHYFIGANPVRLPDPAFRLAAADYLNRLGKAYALLTQNKEKWAKVISPVIQIPEDIVLSDLKAQNHPYHMRPWTETDIQSAQAVVDTFIEQRIIVTRPDLKSVFSNDLAPLLKG